ncbi:hypothetical protein Btru_055993 [Bulinus truncatus]|nr:hypothetical protein Btru_055993 [Bulinus truncatus]
MLFARASATCCVQGAFDFPALEGDPITMDCPFPAVQWFITTNNYSRLVARCSNLNCTNNEPNDYLASVSQASANRNSTSILLVKSVRRPGLAAECKVNSTFTPYAWKLNAIVRPTKPQCSIPVPQADGETVSVQCQTMAYPKANCTIYVQGQSNVTTKSGTYDHVWSPTSNLTVTTCQLSFYVKDAVWNDSALFRVGAYPSLNLGNSFVTYNNWSLIFVQDAPKVIAITANSQSGFLVVSPNSLVTIRCIAVGSAGATFSIYNLTTNRLLNTTAIPNILEYVLRDVTKSTSMISCQSGDDISSRKLIRVYVGPENGPVTQFTANAKSAELSVTQGSDVLLNCTGDGIPGHKLVLTYHFISGVETIMDEAELPANILHVFHNVPCGNLSHFSCRVDDRLNTEKRINISVECLKETCCDSAFPIIPVAAGIASGVGLILLVIIIFCLCKRCQHQKSESTATAAANINHYDSAKNSSQSNKAYQNNTGRQKHNFSTSFKNGTHSSDVSDKGGVDADSLAHSDYSTYSTTGYNPQRNAPKRMSILRSSSRKKLASSLYSETFSNDPNGTMRNGDIYHINKGYVSDSDTSLNHYASSSVSSVMVPPSYETSASSSKEYAVPYSVRNRDYSSGIRPQKTPRMESKQVYKPPSRSEYDEPYGHGYSTEV